MGHGSLLSFGHSCTLGAKAGRSDPRGSAGAGLGAADTGCIRNDSGRHALSDAHAGRGSGEWAVRGEARAETRVHVRTGIRNAVRRLVLSGSSSLATAGDVAAPSRMEPSVSAGGKPMLVVRSAIDRLRFSLRPPRTEVWSGVHAGRVEVLPDRSAASLLAADTQIASGTARGRSGSLNTEAAGLQPPEGDVRASDASDRRHGVPFGVLRTSVATACAGRQWCLG